MGFPWGQKPQKKLSCKLWRGVTWVWLFQILLSGKLLVLNPTCVICTEITSSDSGNVTFPFKSPGGELKHTINACVLLVSISRLCFLLFNSCFFHLPPRLAKQGAIKIWVGKMLTNSTGGPLLSRIVIARWHWSKLTLKKKKKRKVLKLKWYLDIAKEWRNCTCFNEPCCCH